MNIEQVSTLNSEITSLEQRIREHINTSRHQKGLLADHANWNQICSSLDIVGDTVYAVQDYFESDFPENVGSKYLIVYGFLQALFIQQDAVRHLAESFECEHEYTDELKSVRGLRNSAVGHPTREKIGKVQYSSHITRISICKAGFTLGRYGENGESEYVDVGMVELAKSQGSSIIVSLTKIAEKLEAVEKAHKERFSVEPLINLFHDSMPYFFSKVSEGIHGHNPTARSFGLSMLSSIEEKYGEFKKALEARKELHDHIQYELTEYFHAIGKLKSFLSEEAPGLSEFDARIYHFYLRNQHDFFKQIAKEIDAEYTAKA